MKSVIILIVLLLSALAAYGGYIYGKQAGASYGYNEGYSVGSRNAEADRLQLESKYKSEAATLRQTNDKLAEDYEKLRQSAVNAVNAASTYKVPVRCNTSTYGITGQYSSTTCY